MILSAFKTYVRQTFKRTDKDTELVQSVNDMLVWLSLQMPQGNYKYQSWVPTVIGQEDYPIPTNALHLMHPVKLLDGFATNDSGYPLERLTKAEYDIREPNPNRSNPSTGCPSAYAMYSRSILVTPIPDSTDYLLEINWSRRPTALSADADLPVLGSEWDEVLKQGTLDRLYASVGLMDESLYWQSQYRTPTGEPIGLCKTLLEIEQDREESRIGQVNVNPL